MWFIKTKLFLVYHADFLHSFFCEVKLISLTLTSWLSIVEELYNINPFPACQYFAPPLVQGKN